MNCSGAGASACQPLMNEIVRLALEEDIGPGDVTSIACVPETRMAAGRFLAREPLTLSGIGLLWEIYQACRVQSETRQTLMMTIRRKTGTATNSRFWNWLAVPALPPARNVLSGSPS